MHTWSPGGSLGRWVLHSSASNGKGSDARGVGMGEDYIGPMSSVKQARGVAEAMTHAYEAGVHEAEALGAQQRGVEMDRIRHDFDIQTKEILAAYAQLQRTAAEAVALSDVTDTLDEALVELCNMLPEQMVAAARAEVHGDALPSYADEITPDHLPASETEAWRDEADYETEIHDA